MIFWAFVARKSVRETETERERESTKAREKKKGEAAYLLHVIEDIVFLARRPGLEGRGGEGLNGPGGEG